LGHLNYIRIWHDNSGQGKWGSWYLKYILIKDLQTKQQYYFICKEWLGVEKDDGVIDRILPVAGEAQKTEFNYLLQKQATKNLSDGHLWFSIFARPVQSAFTRVERITCCFVLLFISMLMNILYYGLGEETSNGGITIGPFYLTPEQIGIGVIVNLIVFPPSLLIVELFRRSRKRITRTDKIREAIKQNFIQATDVNPELLE
jgi:polycystin 1L2